MQLLILLASAILVRGDIYKPNVYIGKTKQQTEILIDNITVYWYSMDVDSSTNDLYFIDAEKPAILNLDSGALIYIEGITDALSIDVDQESNEVYIGTKDGIHKYTPNTGTVKKVGATTESVWHMFFKGVLFYTKFGSNSIHTLQKGVTDNLDNLQLVHNFVIDKENVVFFSNGTGLYSQHRDSNYTTLHYNDSYVYSLTLDKNDNVYFTTTDGIFEFTKQDGALKKIRSLKTQSAIAFDKNNNLIFSDDHSIYNIKEITEGAMNKCKYTDNFKTLESKLNSLENIDKLVTAQVKMLERMEKSINDLSKKIDKLTDHVEKKK